MLTLVAERAESLWDVVLPVEARELPEDLARLDVLLAGGVVVADRGGVALGVPADWPVGFERGASDDRDGDVRTVDGAQGAPWVGVPNAGERGLRLSAFAAVLPDRPVGTGTGRVDGSQADAPGRTGDGERDHACVDLQGVPGEAFPCSCCEDRLDCHRGRRALSDRREPRGAFGVRVLARQARQTMLLVKEKVGVRDRSRVMGRTLRAISRTIRRRSGEAKSEVLALTAKTGQSLEESIRKPDASRLARAIGHAGAARNQAGRGQEARRIGGSLREGRQADQVACRGEAITDRLVSISNPDARPIRKGKLGKPNEFGYVAQICEVTENTRRGARGLILPAASAPGNPGENKLLPTTVSELARLGISLREVALDGGFQSGPTNEALAEIAPERVFISGRQQPGSKRTQRRLQRYRTGAEGRISHLKRGYGLRPKPTERPTRTAHLVTLEHPRLQP